MKIMMVSCSALPWHNSGVAQVIHHIAEQLIDSKHQVYIFTLNDEINRKIGHVHTISYGNYEVHSIKTDYTHQNRSHAFTEENYKQPIVQKCFIEYLDSVKPDVVHFHSIQGMDANMISIAKHKGVKTVVTMHDWWWMCPQSFMANNDYECCNQRVIEQEKCIDCIAPLNDKSKTKTFLEERKKYLLDILAQSTDCILVVSAYLLEYVQQNMPQLKNVYINSNGVELPKKQYNNTTSDTVRLGFLGGIQTLKGYALLQEALPLITVKDWEVHLYSVPQVGKQGLKKVCIYWKKEGVKGLIKKLGQLKKAYKKEKITGKVVIHPPYTTEQKEEVFGNIDILLSLSTVKESSSLVVREALVRGIPVLTTNSGGPLDVIVPGYNGEVIKDLHPRSVAESIEKLLHQAYYLKLKDNLTKNPYTYTYDKQVQDLEKIYKKLIEGVRIGD